MSCLKRVFQASERLSFSFFRHQSKLYTKTYVLKASGRLHFSLFLINQYCTSSVILQKMCVQSNLETAFWFIKLHFNTKNICSKQAEGCFLVYSLLVTITLLKCFYYKFYKTSVNDVFFAL